MVTEINISCTDQRLNFINRPLIASGGVNEDIVNFTFCAKWDGFAKTAVFYRDEENVYHQVLTNDSCYIPHEVLKDAGILYISVFGVKDGVIRTSQILKCKIVSGAITENTEVSDPTPEIYNQILSSYNEAIQKYNSIIDGTIPAETANKLKTARTISLGTGVVGTATNFDGSENITIPVTEIKESYLSWGGKNTAGEVSPMGTALSSELNANRIAFLNPDAITIETSIDAGATWVNGNYNDEYKQLVVSSNTSFSSQKVIHIGSSSPVTTGHRTRITLTATDGTNQYFRTRVRKMLFGVNTYNHEMEVIIEAKKGISNAAWETLGAYPISGYPGWNEIPIVINTLGGAASQTSNYWYLRLTFAVTTLYSDRVSYRPFIVNMRMFGEEALVSPSNMSSTGHLYSYDYQQNATFPAKVTASGGFVGVAKAGESGTFTISSRTSSTTASYATQPLTNDAILVNIWGYLPDDAITSVTLNGLPFVPATSTSTVFTTSSSSPYTLKCIAIKPNETKLYCGTMSINSSSNLVQINDGSEIGGSNSMFNLSFIAD